MVAGPDEEPSAETFQLSFVRGGCIPVMLDAVAAVMAVPCTGIGCAMAGPMPSVPDECACATCPNDQAAQRTQQPMDTGASEPPADLLCQGETPLPS